MTMVSGGRGNAFATLRRFAIRTAKTEQCDFCKESIPPSHPRVVEVARRRLVCVCPSCAAPPSRLPEYKLVPERVRFLQDFRLPETVWTSLAIPIGLAFFLQAATRDRVMAFYPSPAGPTESLLPLENWTDLVAENPALREMEPDVEALLVNRLRRPGFCDEYYLAPIDKCYELVGLIRSHWRGLSGGDEVWRELGSFFARLKKMSHVEAPYA